MSRLFLLRHAKAIWAKPAMKDFDRPLDEEGISSLNELAEAMKASKLFPEKVLLSASCRTRETAFGLIERLGIDAEMIIDETIYSGGAGEYMQAIKKNADSDHLMLVGHNPSMEDLALALCGDGEPSSLSRLEAGFPTAALATITFDGPLSDIARGKGFLESFPLPC
ncbi:SixA phosphatase family protein [Ochrobactrum quorumnocens]|jgi:phosphohistidine phosphatase|uniref:Histidine phosphatase family protein n=1 Tax=Ochrobactrum quorumnocens TaxID=271865 RepID=A0A5N1JRM2_9HYPH|nr:MULTISPECIES: histidine phosphatase family protein [Brucella]KAA9366443.1 histidine phosphatase family protein [[Ochrobactrum] quorumnocens]MBD7992659.1 histidine phosphatase family protein [Ochrobactrum gallinarum]MCV9907240.1 histidine phosphatase family protein [Brucella sp. HL-2]